VTWPVGVFPALQGGLPVVFVVGELSCLSAGRATGPDERSDDKQRIGRDRQQTIAYKPFPLALDSARWPVMQCSE